MKRPFAPSDNGKRFLHIESGYIGTLEAPPLTDPGTAEPGEGILWVTRLQTWFYVKPEEVEPT